MENFLNEKKENVVITHCLAGKGRTGTIICCFLLWIGMFKNTKDVRDFYG